MESQESKSISGIIVCHKITGMTSMDVIRIVRRLTGVKKVGHGGTLDPIASGVLPLFIGQATRVTEYILNSSKEYSAVIQLGEETDTYDREGTVIKRHDYSSVSRELFDNAVSEYLGSISQKPPMYSALKVGGTRLYKLARAGIEVEREYRKVCISSITVTDWHPPFVTLHIKCGRGVYVRSLVHDIGQTLSCGAHVRELTRMSVGDFTLRDALVIDNAHQPLALNLWQRHLQPLDSVLLSIPACLVDHEQETLVKSGGSIDLGTNHPMTTENHCRRIYNKQGYFIGLVKAWGRQPLWKPQKVFETSEASPFAPNY